MRIIIRLTSGSNATHLHNGVVEPPPRNVLKHHALVHFGDATVCEIRQPRSPLRHCRVLNLSSNVSRKKAENREY